VYKYVIEKGGYFVNIILIIMLMYALGKIRFTTDISLKDLSTIWFSHILTMYIPDEGYSINASCALN